MRLSNDEKVFAGHDVTEFYPAIAGNAKKGTVIGWTMSIDEDDGRMIFSASREKVAFIVFGACTLD